MKAMSWTTWERYMPSAKVQRRTGANTLCLKPWDQILPEEGIEERMRCTEPLWRTWERYLPLERADLPAYLPVGLRAQRPEKVPV